jgi:outer membrane lipoprotein-sorting protein
MLSLRTISTPRLAALCASAVAVVGGGTAIALAGGNGAAPPPKPLANAVHDALAAPPTQGITARVEFTNHLVDSAGLQGQNPLLSGASGRLWLSPGKGMRLELQSDSGDAQIVANQNSFWIYDGTSNTVYRGTIPADRGRHAGRAERTHHVPSVARIQMGLNRLAKRVHVSGATPGNVGGQPAYTVRVGPPNKPGGLLGAAALAFDAARGVPLRAALYARGNNTPVLELTATDVSYGAVPASTYSISPPAGAKTVDVMPSGGARGHGGGKQGKRAHRLVSGRAAVARKLPFQLSAPDALAGRPREVVKLIKLKKGPAAVVTYGNGPGGIAVIERAEAANASAPAPRHGDRHGRVQLPTVAIGSATGTVLDTPLGSMVNFSRAGVSYTVIGSVPAAVAEAAARGL